MKKLNKADIKEIDDISTALRDKTEELEKAITQYNNAVSSAWDDVETSLNELNDVISNAAEIRDDIVNRIDEYVSERSEKWQESDAASEMESWKSEWETITLDTIEIEKPADLEVPDFDPEELGNVRAGVNE